MSFIMSTEIILIKEPTSFEKKNTKDTIFKDVPFSSLNKSKSREKMIKKTETIREKFPYLWYFGYEVALGSISEGIKYKRRCRLQPISNLMLRCTDQKAQRTMKVTTSLYYNIGI